MQIRIHLEVVTRSAGLDFRRGRGCIYEHYVVAAAAVRRAGATDLS